MGAIPRTCEQHKQQRQAARWQSVATVQQSCKALKSMLVPSAQKQSQPPAGSAQLCRGGNKRHTRQGV